MASLDDLPGPVRAWVQRKRIDSGNYASGSDYVRALILRDQAEDDREQAVVNALIEAEQSGISLRKVRDILAAIRKEATGPA